jgi:hypothetical protein
MTEGRNTFSRFSGMLPCNISLLPLILSLKEKNIPKIKIHMGSGRASKNGTDRLFGT